MLTHQLLRNLILMILVVTLGGCQTLGTTGSASTQDEPSVTASVLQPSATPTAGPTTTRTETPGPTSTVTRTPYPSTPASQPTPNLYSSPIAKDLLFSGDPSCKLPCWYGLRIDESHVTEIPVAFRQALALPDSYVLSMWDDSQNSGNVKFRWEDPKTLSEGAPAGLTLLAGFDPTMDLLKSFAITLTHPSFLSHTTPGHVLREMGIPSKMWARFSPTEASNVGILQVMMLYFEKESNNWVFLAWSIHVPIDLTRKIARWCLDGAKGQQALSFSLESPPEFDPQTRTDYSEPLQTVLSISPEDLFKRVTQETNVCVNF